MKKKINNIFFEINNIFYMFGLIIYYFSIGLFFTLIILKIEQNGLIGLKGLFKFLFLKYFYLTFPIIIIDLLFYLFIKKKNNI